MVSSGSVFSDTPICHGYFKITSFRFVEDFISSMSLPTSANCMAATRWTEARIWTIWLHWHIFFQLWIGLDSCGTLLPLVFYGMLVSVEKWSWSPWVFGSRQWNSREIKMHEDIPGVFWLRTTYCKYTAHGNVNKKSTQLSLILTYLNKNTYETLWNPIPWPFA